MGETEAALLAQRVKKEHSSDEPEPEPDVALADGSSAAAPGSEPENAVTADEKLPEVVDQSADEMSSSNGPSGAPRLRGPICPCQPLLRRKSPPPPPSCIVR
jgi:hypothetical protein